MSNYTPGPWQQGETDNHWKRSIRARGDSIAFCGSFPDEEAHANARLIAAAPELLNELEMLANIIEGCGIELPPEVEGQLVFAREAIAKAKGESA